jgi:hypothetical protein
MSMKSARLLRLAGTAIVALALGVVAPGAVAAPSATGATPPCHEQFEPVSCHHGPAAGSPTHNRASRMCSGARIESSRSSSAEIALHLIRAS